MVNCVRYVLCFVIYCSVIVSEATVGRIVLKFGQPKRNLTVYHTLALFVQRKSYLERNKEKKR